MRIAAVALMMAVAATVPAAAKKIPAQFLAGTILASNNAGICWTDGGATNFRRTDPTGDVLMTMAEIDYNAGSLHSDPSFAVNGQADLAFTSPTAGNIYFSNSLYEAVDQVPFSNYAETYDAPNGKLTVSFNINFVNGCTLPISAVFYK